jgi:DNA-directed RNA polymerase I, II, and III subunit RPABC1
MEESYRLWRVRKTVLEMLRDRGYSVYNGGEQDEKEYTNIDITMKYEKFKESYGKSGKKSSEINRDTLEFFTSKVEEIGDQIFVGFASAVKIGVKEINSYQMKMKEAKVKRGILVIQTNPKVPSSQAMKAIENLSHKGYIIELFKEAELLVNITEHVLVPKHVPLALEEKEALMKRYKLKDHQLPRMLVTDPISRYYGLSRGAVVKIIRPSETSGRYVTYRHVQ